MGHDYWSPQNLSMIMQYTEAWRQYVLNASNVNNAENNHWSIVFSILVK